MFITGIRHQEKVVHSTIEFVERTLADAAKRAKPGERKLKDNGKVAHACTVRHGYWLPRQRGSFTRISSGDSSGRKSSN